MRLLFAATFAILGTAIAAPTATAQAIEYVQRPERADGYYPRVLRGHSSENELKGGAETDAKSHRYSPSKIVKVPQGAAPQGIRVFKGGKVSAAPLVRSNNAIKPVVFPKVGKVTIFDVPDAARRGTVVVHKPNAFRAVPDQHKVDE